MSLEDNKYEKYIPQLEEAAKRTKTLIEDVLKKSETRFREEVNQTESEEKKIQAQKKLNKISNELELLKVLPEDEIVSFALSTDKNLMVIASNRRTPQEQRMKARVASHKPLSTLLGRVKSLAGDQDVEELFSTKLNKVSLNNQIILMRKHVKRAKVHVIHKLTRTITLLRKSKGSEQKKAKLERKAERLTKKVKRIDELHEDEIAKFALTTTEDLNRLCTDIKMPMDTQAMATIALHKFVAVPVAEYKKAFPDLQKTAPKMLKKKKKRKSKLTIETKENSKDHNISKLKLNTNKSNDKINNSEVLQSSDDESNGSDSGKLSDMNSDCMSDKDVESDQNDIGDHQSDIDIDDHSDIDMDDNMSNPIENNSSNIESEIEYADEIIPKLANKSNKLKQKKSQSVLKSKEDILLSRSNDEKKIIHKDKVKVVKKKAPEEHLAEDKPKFVDPFFVTVENKEYLTSQEPKFSDLTSSNQNEKPNRFNRVDRKNKFDTRENIDRHQNKTGKWGRKEGDWRRNEYSNTGTNDRKHNFGNNERNWQANKFNRHTPYYKKSFTNNFDKVSNRSEGSKFHREIRKDGRQPFQQPVKEPPAVKLHPSWEAKKKQATVAAFQGKKITFD